MTMKAGGAVLTDRAAGEQGPVDTLAANIIIITAHRQLFPTFGSVPCWLTQPWFQRQQQR